MRKTPIVGYIWLGTAIRFLIDTRAGASVHTEGGVLENLDGVNRGLERYGLPVSSTHFDVHGLADLRERLASLPKDASLTDEQALELTRLMANLRLTIDAEAHNAYAYRLDDRRFTSEVLLNDIGRLIAKDLWASLPTIAQADLEDGGKCIAFNLPTSAAFHLVRAAEATLKMYYTCLILRNRLKNPMWAAMTTQLKAKRMKPVPPVLLDQLDGLRKNFRNPTQHPEKVYDIEEAQDLLAAVCDAVSRILRDMQNRGLVDPS